jgi:hypothetical protein
VPGTKRVTELCCFLEFCFYFFFFLIECAGCLYNFVQMTAEPGKAVAFIIHILMHNILLLLVYIYIYIYIYIFFLTSKLLMSNTIIVNFFQ